MTATKKSLLHLTPLAECGGCEVNCLRIIEARRDFEHRVVVFGEPGPMSAAWERAGAQVEHLRAWERGPIGFAAAFTRWREARTVPTAVIYWSSSRLPTVLRVLRRWDTAWAVHLGNPLHPGIVPRIRRRVHDWIHPAPSAVTLVACSNHVAESHRQAGYFRRFATEVVYNPVDPALDREHSHRPLPRGSAPRVGMVARLDKIKDHRTVIRALAEATSRRPDMVIEFAGDGPLLEELQREATVLKVAGQVKFLGFTPVGPLLAQWDLYVHSTTQSEGMGTALAEAMMAGLPCLVSDLSVMREVCGPDGAVYVQPGNPSSLAGALIELVEDPAMREAYGHAAQNRARRLFGLSRAASAYVSAALPGSSKGTP